MKTKLNALERCNRNGFTDKKSCQRDDNICSRKEILKIERDSAPRQLCECFSTLQSQKLEVVLEHQEDSVCKTDVLKPIQRIFPLGSASKCWGPPLTCPSTPMWSLFCPSSQGEDCWLHQQWGGRPRSLNRRAAQQIPLIALKVLCMEEALQDPETVGFTLTAGCVHLDLEHAFSLQLWSWLTWPSPNHQSQMGSASWDASAYPEGGARNHNSTLGRLPCGTHWEVLHGPL